MKRFILQCLYEKMLGKIFNPFLFNIKPMPLDLSGGRYLVIAPHPDDESIGCGGILNLYPKNFDVVCLTHGEENSLRRSEFSAAMDFAGVKNWRMLTCKDKKIIDGWTQFKTIDISPYDCIFVPHIFDQHKDHKAVSVLLDKLLREKTAPKNLKVAFYEVWSAINMPQFYVDISSVTDKKRKMIEFHASQSGSGYARRILGLNCYRGLLKGVDAAEAFAVMDCADFKKLVAELV